MFALRLSVMVLISPAGGPGSAGARGLVWPWDGLMGSEASSRAERSVQRLCPAVTFCGTAVVPVALYH